MISTTSRLVVDDPPKIAGRYTPAKYDLRSWSPDHQKMGKGSTFTEDELKALKELLNKLEF